MSRNIKCYPSFVSFYFLLNILQTLLLPSYIFSINTLFLFSFSISLHSSSSFFFSLSPDFFLAQTKFFFKKKKNPSSNLAFILNPLSGSMTQRRQISAYLGMALLIPLKSDLFFDVVINFHLLRMLSLIKIVEDLHQNQVSLTPRLEAQEAVNDAFHSFMARKTATNDRVQDMLAQILS